LDDTIGQLAAAIKNAGTPDPETRLELYSLMQSCRVMEQRAYDLFMQNLIKGTSHLALGQEAVAAGFGAAMREDDYSFCTYRGHNHTC
jgi:pyruvate dehydrogenase E1 component alpha subunit